MEWKQKTCFICEKQYESRSSHSKFCSPECRNLNHNMAHGRSSKAKTSPVTVGAVTEMIVAVELMRECWDVFRALSPGCGCDLIGTRDGETIRIEVKTGYKGLSGKVSYPYPKSGNYDVVAVHVWAEEKTYFFDKEGRECNLY